MANPQVPFQDPGITDINELNAMRSSPNPMDLEEDAPEDEIRVLPDGSIEIGPPEDDEHDEGLREFDDNLTDLLEDDELTALGAKMVEDYHTDEEDRKDWLEIYQKGLKSLRPDAENPAGNKLSKAIHPIMAEVATQFQARTIVELFPPQGPVGCTIIGEPTEETQAQATRVRTYMNYQISEEMEEYYDDLDQMLFHLPLVGQTYKKTYYDVDLNRTTSRFVRADKLVVNVDASSLQTAARSHELMEIPQHMYSRYVYAGYYDEMDEDVTGAFTTDNTEGEIEGTDTPSDPDTNPFQFIESHVYLDIESEDDEPDRPYIVTTNYETGQVVAIRRNWDEDDETYRKNVWYTVYRFLPGLGFYGFGLYHIIGGLGSAATGALRSLLDAAAFSNMQGGFKLRGRVKGGEITIAPGEFTDIEAAVDDVKKAIMPLPFKEPSPTMMALLEFVVRTAKEFAATAQTGVSDANQNTPVGTTMALMEEQNRVFSAVHKRLHRAQRHEFKLIAKLNGLYLPERYPYSAGGNSEILRADFDNRIDIIPVSDPSTFSSTQRIAQAQAMLQLATQYPQEHRLNAALRRMYEAMRVPNYDEVLIDQSSDLRMDAVAENTAIMKQMPVKVFEDQDHVAHVQVLDGWFAMLPPEMQQGVMPIFMAHRSEHTAMLYRTMVQARLQAPLPPVPTDENNQYQITPEMDAQISQAAAQLMSQNPQGPLIPPAPQPGPQQGQQGDPMEAAKMMAQVEAMSIQAKAQADVEAKKLKAQTDSEIRMAEAQLEMQIDAIKAQTKAQQDLIREQYKGEQEAKKLDAELTKSWAKAANDMAIAREKAYAGMQTEKHHQRMKETHAQLSLALSPRQVPDAQSE